MAYISVSDLSGYDPAPCTELVYNHTGVAGPGERERVRSRPELSEDKRSANVVALVVEILGRRAFCALPREHAWQGDSSLMFPGAIPNLGCALSTRRSFFAEV